MDYILNIHTSTEVAVVNICKEESALGTLTNTDSKQHASFLHEAIHSLLKENNIEPNQLAAIGVTEGPGSYTGIRVGLATAKGLCYALNIPLITFSTLEVMAMGAIDQEQNKEALYCPLIDARRMEVFTSVFDFNLEVRLLAQAIELNEFLFGNLFVTKEIIMFGSGSDKMQMLRTQPNWRFIDFKNVDTLSLGRISWKRFQNKEFSDVALSQPAYLKEFYFPPKK
ncbi:MAG: tRNA (adenosine(37)-N6)-threonylcarbamoyltransferase complex dimerization subunit type 1 TsaB [Ginsengibacter sp.]